MKPLDITGQRFGRLVAISRAANSGRRTKWLFQCDCGTQKIVGLEGVSAGRARSCGCLQADVIRKRSVTHGQAGTVEYKAWLHAKSRCFNKADPKYPHYGGRGITMCAEWVNDFSAFLRDMGLRPPDKTSIDREKVHLGYEPGNCRWANSHEQARTRTDNVYVEMEGKRLVLKDYAAAIGFPYKKLSAVLRRQLTALRRAINEQQSNC